MFDFLKNTFLNRGRYKTHSEAVIVSCFYNPQNSPYRLLAFHKWYRSIKHLNYRIIECLIGDAKSQLPDDPNIIRVQTDSVLWHKESLLNKAIAELPEKFKYVFWVDADVLFTNDNWLVDSVEQLESGANIVQPFEYCVHLERNQLKPGFNMELAKKTAGMTNKELNKGKRLWRSFCANMVDMPNHGNDKDYDRHGHVGFAWGARREVLEACPLFDRALIGGADHIIAHAAAGQVPHACITNGFADNIDEVLEWSKNFYRVVRGRIGYASGDLYHIWHGDIAARQYLKRIQDFTDQTTKIKDRDKNGLHVSGGRDGYVRRYYQDREVPYVDGYDYEGFDAGFYEDMGYTISDIIYIFGQPQYYDEGGVAVDQPNEGDSDFQLMPFDQPEGVSDFQLNDQVPFDQGGAGIPDDGQHIITDEMLQGAISDDQPEFTPADDLAANDDGGNFS
jgi:hypothetical protein